MRLKLQDYFNNLEYITHQAIIKSLPEDKRNNQKDIILVNGKTTIEEVIWHKNEMPYVIEGIVEIQADKRLKIDPGVMVKFYGEAYLSISGTLIAQGTETESITFTAFGGFWKNISFTKSSKDSILENVIVSHGGGFNVLGQINVKDCAIEMRNSTSTNSINLGIYLENSSSSIENSYFADQPQGIRVDGWGAFPHFGEGLTFKDNFTDIYIIEKTRWCALLPAYLRTYRTNCP